MPIDHAAGPFGVLLRHWREHRRLSQLALSSQAGVSSRHLSFVETGRSSPSRDMVLRLADELELPLRERNRLLLAAGYAPVYSQTSLDAPQMAAFHAALRQILISHEPYPAVVIDRAWNLVEANISLSLFTDLIAVDLLEPPANVLRACLHPDGLAPKIINLGQWRAHLLARLRREIEITGDADLIALRAELRSYPCDQPEPKVEPPGPGEIVAPLRIRYGNDELAFFSTIATFGTPMDITLAELSIESFYPATQRTVAILRSRSQASV